MLGGREKIGDTNIEWERVAFGKGKYRRKTIGFGKYDKKTQGYSDLEIHIRELSILEAGIGCAIWDAAIILSRWILEHRDLFEGKYVLELGSGVGLPGIAVAYFAEKVVLTDYIPQLLENLNYNISLNCNTDEEGGEIKKTKDISQNTTVAYLNWDEIDSEEVKHEADVQPFVQPIERADVIIGSELTYSPLSVYTLTKVIEKYLKPDGVFYEVLSDDRDGVPLFLDVIQEAGFEVQKEVVPESMMGNFQTKQRPETYKVYTFKRVHNNNNNKVGEKEPLGE